MSKIFKFRRAGDLCGEDLPGHSSANTLQCVGQQCRNGVSEMQQHNTTHHVATVTTVHTCARRASYHEE